jgi:pre-mRNA-splicing factor ISY1
MYFDFIWTCSKLEHRCIAESLDEHKIRELNDEINKLLREKYHWEKRIRDLGGADYSVRRNNVECYDVLLNLPFPFAQRTSKVIDEDAIIGPGGYIYFGAAKKLPGVQELVRPDGSLSLPIAKSVQCLC